VESLAEKSDAPRQEVAWRVFDGEGLSRDWC
jgi:hypothetical protein